MAANVNVLKEALFARGVTQARLAEFLGVYPNTVYKWASGVSSIPRGRAYLIEGFLELESGALDELATPEDARPTLVAMVEPVTMLDWVVQNLFAGRIGYREVVESMTSSLANLYRVKGFLAGVELIPVEVIDGWADDLWPGFQPDVLKWEAAVFKSEADVVAEFVAALPWHTEVTDFESVSRLLEDYRLRPRQDPARAAKLLRREDRPDTDHREYLESLAEGFARG